MAAVLGTGIIPAILGMCGDAGSFGAGFIAMGLMNFAALGALVKTAGSRG
jgi:NNP family nitrate/nitrite transporter-like MFS transporter